jgi:hypothetical protein
MKQMKKLITLTLMLCFTLALCTVGRSAPSAAISPPAKEKIVIKDVQSIDQAIQQAATVSIFYADEVSQPAEVPVNEVKFWKPSITPIIYREPERRRIPVMAYGVNKPPNKLE